MSRVAVVLNTGGADRCDGCSQLVESFRSVVELSIFLKYVKNSKNCINSNVWRSLGAIGIESVSFEAFRSASSFFIFFSILEFWLGRARRRGFLA